MDRIGNNKASSTWIQIKCFGNQSKETEKLIKNLTIVPISNCFENPHLNSKPPASLDFWRLARLTLNNL